MFPNLDPMLMGTTLQAQFRAVDAEHALRRSRGERDEAADVAQDWQEHAMALEARALAAEETVLVLRAELAAERALAQALAAQHPDSPVLPLADLIREVAAAA